MDETRSISIDALRDSTIPKILQIIKGLIAPAVFEVWVTEGVK